MSIISPNSSARTGQMITQYQRNTKKVSTALEHLSTGKRINRASDDPAGYIGAEQLRGDLVVMEAESRVSYAQRFKVHQRQSALGEIQNVLNSVRGSLVSAADGSNSKAQSQAIQTEINAALDAIDLIAEGVEGVAGSSALSALREGGGADVLNGDISAAAELVDAKLSSLSRARAAEGAYEKYQIDVFDQLREDQIVITTEALSQLEDTDFAEEASNLVSGQILTEATLAAMAFSRREQIQLMEILLKGINRN